jgi:endoglucanase
MKELLLASVLLLIVGDVAFCAANENIKVDMIGYLPEDAKYVIVTQPAKSFTVKNLATGKQVFFGDLNGPLDDYDTGDVCFTGNFTELKDQGDYTVEVSGMGNSYNFSIGRDIYRDVLYKSMRGFYLQRCGTAVSDPGGWTHDECHVKPAILHKTTGEYGTLDVAGGWHDAGDYGKYTVNSGISTATLLYMFERREPVLSKFKLNIPESGGKYPDVLAEAKYNLDWMLKMQAKNGGAYHKVTPMFFCAMQKKAEDDADDQFVYEITTTATGNLAAVAALASRILKKHDEAYSVKCLAAAVRAWKYLEANPEIVPAGGFKNPEDTKTGDYGDGFDRDERLWTAVELYLATGEQVYHEYVLKHYSSWKPLIGSPAYWWEANVTAMLAYAYSAGDKANQDLLDKIKTDLINYADVLMGRIKENGYRYVLDQKEYIWGSNSVALNSAINLLAAADMAEKTASLNISREKIASYRQGAADVLHYMLGRNPFNMSYVTGVGEKSVLNIHHRPSASDTIPDPYPGLLAGGPNMKRNDDKLKELPFDTKPGRCYVDELYSYASNEIAINWNAPLAYVLSYFIY